MSIDNNDLLGQLKDIFDSFVPKSSSEEWPKEALPLGTLVRTTRLDALGVITDAFYGDIDADNKKIIIYTLFLFPKKRMQSLGQIPQKYYLINEYEYDVIGYLMMKPINVDNLMSTLEGGF